MIRFTLLVSGLLLLFVVLLSLPGVAATTKETKPAPPTKREQALLEAAQEANRLIVEKGQGLSLDKMAELNYLWSKRMLDAERDVARDNKQVIAALKAHLSRMAKLEADRKKEEFRKTAFGKLPYKPDQLAQIAAVVFYRTEAELWGERAKSKQ
jgi:hypothetical protein